MHAQILRHLPTKKKIIMYNYCGALTENAHQLKNSTLTVTFCGAAQLYYSNVKMSVLDQKSLEFFSFEICRQCVSYTVLF